MSQPRKNFSGSLDEGEIDYESVKGTKYLCYD